MRFTASEIWTQVDEGPRRSRTSGPYTNIVHKQNYSKHSGKEYNFKCPVHKMVYICNAKDSATFRFFTDKL